MQVALIGAPNVGKSSLVNVLSSGTPEVCDYPFTTRSIKMGHFYVNGIRHQVWMVIPYVVGPAHCQLCLLKIMC
jgi:GTP1/Obg family GTP-binding protein